MEAFFPSNVIEYLLLQLSLDTRYQWYTVNMHFCYSFTYKVQKMGTNVDEAKVMIGSSGLKILPVDNLDEAARLSCKLSKIVAISRDAHLDVKFEMPI